MLQIIVATHGLMSQEVVNSSYMIFGQQEDVHAVTFVPGQGPADLLAKYKEILAERAPGNETLILVDLFGGSPYNAATQLAVEDETVGLVAGVNLGMLIELYGMRNNSLEAVTTQVVEAGKYGIVAFELQEEEDDDLL
jgi:mannose/fructose/sorbose-specific phosphotransferase system IIA component